MTRRIYSCRHPEEAKFYTWDKALSHGADVTVAMSVRDLGKSYGMFQTMKKSAKNGRNSVVTRWEVGELEKMSADMFSQEEILTKENPEGTWRKVSVSTSAWFFERADNGAQIWFMSVKASNKNKGADIKNLDWWFYDEFIPEIYDTQTRRVEEFRRFTSMYWTLVRNNQKFRVVMACNTITWFNGYFDAWNIKPFASGKIVRQTFRITHGDIERTMTIVVENVKPTHAMMERILKHAAIAGKGYNASYFENMTNDNYGFIQRCPDMSIPLFRAQWVFMGRCYSFRSFDGLYFWCETPKRDVDTYTTSKTDVGPGVIRDRGLGITFSQLYDSGKFRFDNGHVQQTVLNMIWAGRQNQI